MFTIGKIVGLAEWIIYDTCLVVIELKGKCTLVQKKEIDCTLRRYLDSSFLEVRIALKIWSIEA